MVLKQSFGLMVNYLYDPDASQETNVEAFSATAPSSRQVRCAAPRAIEQTSAAFSFWR